MASITRAEIEVLQKLRSNLSDVLIADDFKTNGFLLKWLRTHDFNLGKTELSIRNHFKWRQENRIDHVKEIVFDDFYRRNMPYNIDGIDKQGRLVVVQFYGKWDIAKCVSRGSEDEFMNYVHQYYERIVSATAMKKNENHNHTDDSSITGATFVTDLEGFSHWKLTNRVYVRMAVKIVKTLETHYPEIENTQTFINATRSFHVLFRLLKPFISSKSLEKCAILGQNRSEWEQYLEKFIAPEEIKRLLRGKIK